MAKFQGKLYKKEKIVVLVNLKFNMNSDIFRCRKNKISHMKCLLEIVCFQFLGNKINLYTSFRVDTYFMIEFIVL